MSLTITDSAALGRKKQGRAPPCSSCAREGVGAGGEGTDHSHRSSEVSMKGLVPRGGLERSLRSRDTATVAAPCSPGISMPVAASDETCDPSLPSNALMQPDSEWLLVTGCHCTVAVWHRRRHCSDTGSLSLTARPDSEAPATPGLVVVLRRIAILNY